MQRWLYRLLEETETWPSRIVDLSILVLIVLSLVTFAWSTMPGLAPGEQRALEYAQLITVILFSIEYVLRLFAAGGKPNSRGSIREAISYATSFYGIIDLLAILPFYLKLGGFIAIRSLRILRLLRLFKIGRYSKALTMFVQVLRGRSGQLGVFLFISVVFTFVASTGIYYFENEKQPEAFSSIPASLWWAMVTLTTVGYGDSFPVTVGGKAFTALVVLLGLGVIAIPTGIISAGMVEAMDKEKGGAKVLQDRKNEGSSVCPECGRPWDTTKNGH